MNTYPLNKSGLKLEKFSPDPLFSQKIKISQPENGYHFSMDPFILAAHVHPTGNEKIIDIGCGCAIMPLLLAFKNPGLNITGVEIQKELFKFARQNVIANNLESTIRIIHKDIKNLTLSDINGRTDMIISNPPYKKKGTGRLNLDSQKAIARHEITLDIELLFKCANKLLKKNGKVYLIFPAERLSDLLDAMEKYKFSLKFFRHIYIKKNELPKRFILCAVKDSDISCIVRPPLFIYASENKFSKEYTCLFNRV